MTKKKEPVTLTATSSLILLNDKRVEFLFLSPYYASSFAKALEDQQASKGNLRLCYQNSFFILSQSFKKMAVPTVASA